MYINGDTVSVTSRLGPAGTAARSSRGEDGRAVRVSDAGSACVVGAGPAGIVTAKTLLEDGFDVTVYEKYDEIGGTWSSHRRYVDLHHQLDKGIMEFADMPNDGAYESAESVQAYLEAYAEEYDLLERIQFQTEVYGLDRVSGGWTLDVRRTDGGRRERNRFDHVAVCCGFHHLPKLPDVPGIEAFAGDDHHSSEVHDDDALEGERVVVVGGGKSAHDLSVRAGKIGRDATMVYREANWMIPKKLLGGRVPHRFILYSRFGESILPEYYNDDCVRLIDRAPGPIKDGIWKIVTRDIVRSAGLHRMETPMVPETELRHNITSAGVMPDEFSDLVVAGSIEPVKGTVERVEADGVRLGDGAFVDADVIVFATGFHKRVPFFDADADLKTDDGQFFLYRSIVPPDVEDIGFVGLRQTFNNFISMEVTAHWLSAYFKDELIESPTTEEMYETIDRRLEWLESEMPDTGGFDFGPYNLHTVDELLIDLGVATRRSRNPVAEYLLPGARGRRYAGLKREREEAVAATTTPGGPAASALSAITSALRL